MLSRTELHEKLVEALGSRNVYYQPPESLKLKYPCIIYSIESIDITHADDAAYDVIKSYAITIVDDDPDSEIPDKFIDMPYCKFSGSYAKDGLNHFRFILFNRR